jgi:membrane protein involved in colicin uptake
MNLAHTLGVMRQYSMGRGGPAAEAKVAADKKMSDKKKAAEQEAANERAEKKRGGDDGLDDVLGIGTGCSVGRSLYEPGWSPSGSSGIGSSGIGSSGIGSSGIGSSGSGSSGSGSIWDD